MMRTAIAALLLLLAASAPAISIVLDYTLDEQNENWFDPTTDDGLARRLAVNAAADFLSVILTNDDWAALPQLNESITFTDIASSTLRGVSGELLFGTPETDGAGFAYTSSSNNIDTTNRSSVDANEYIVYVGAFAFDALTTSNAKAGWDSFDRRNAAGFAGAEFNTWGGRVYFNTAKSWYACQNPGIDPSDDYGAQDPDKTPPFDTSSDNWEWSTSDASWKGFDLASIDPFTGSARDLYGTALHEMLHALGATTSIIQDYVGVDPAGDFIGPALVAEYGGPVPGDGGHFAEDTQAIVWSSDGIVSETLLDPNSRLGVRKYLTRIDAALLTDLGYDVEESFPTGFLQGDYNADGRVDIADYTAWRDALATSTALPNDPSFTEVNADDRFAWVANFGRSSAAVAIPEPAAISAIVLAVALRRRSDGSPLFR